MTDQRERWEEIREDLRALDSGSIERQLERACRGMADDAKRIAELESQLRASEEGEMVKGDRIKELEAEVERLRDASDGWYELFRALGEVLEPENGEKLLDCAKRIRGFVQRMAGEGDD